ncbi:MAG: lysozyme inhibitor LprI family protein [Desulfomonilaceae bacterium]
MNRILFVSIVTLSSSCSALRQSISRLITVFLLLPGICLAASFDCNKATTPVEKLICAEQGLSQFDEKLSRVYEEALRLTPDPQGLKREHEKWLRDVRNLCTDSICLEKEYYNRLWLLEKLLLTVPEQFLGKWRASSRMAEAVYGDLEVKKNSLSLERLGTHNFVILATFDDSVVLEMSESYKGDCGRYIRLGPIVQNSSDPIDRLVLGGLTFAVYDKIDQALAPKRINLVTGKLEYPGYCTWGVYLP